MELRLLRESPAAASLTFDLESIETIEWLARMSATQHSGRWLTTPIR
jgi:hypothetical protein